MTTIKDRLREGARRMNDVGFPNEASLMLEVAGINERLESENAELIAEINSLGEDGLRQMERTGDLKSKIQRRGSLIDSVLNATGKEKLFDDVAGKRGMIYIPASSTKEKS